MVAARNRKRKRYPDRRGRRSDVKRVMDQLRRAHSFPRGSISETRLKTMMTGTCGHCTRAIDWRRGSENLMTRGSFDRVDNSGTHSEDNIMPSCLACNLMRNTMALDTFHAYLRDLATRPGTPVDSLSGWTNTRRRQISDARVKHLFERQGGRCYLTGVAFEETGARRYSVDRLDSSKGYTDDNIALCLVNVNLMKNTASVEQAREHVEHLRTTFSKHAHD